MLGKRQMRENSPGLISKSDENKAGTERRRIARNEEGRK